MKTVNGLDHFEALAEQLVEGTFERLFRPRLHPSDVARRLARAMEDGRIVGDGGQDLLPNQYWVFLNPDDFAALNAGGESLRAELIRYLQCLAAERGARFGGRLRVALHPVVDLSAGQVDVRAAHGSELGDAGDTQEVKISRQPAADAGRWCLRLGGHVFPLGEPVACLPASRSTSLAGRDLLPERHRQQQRHARQRPADSSWGGGSPGCWWRDQPGWCRPHCQRRGGAARYRCFPHPTDDFPRRIEGRATYSESILR
jgi:hypothetical protein